MYIILSKNWERKCVFVHKMHIKQEVNEVTNE